MEHSWCTFFAAWGIGVVVAGLYVAGAVFGTIAGFPESVTTAWCVIGCYCTLCAQLLRLAGWHRIHWWYSEEI